MLIDFCTYNIHDLNSKQNSVKDFLSLNNLSLCALIETHVKQDFATQISSFICPKLSWLFNYEHHVNGRIWVGWDPDVWTVVATSTSGQQITCSIKHISSQESFVISFIYGFNTTIQR